MVKRPLDFHNLETNIMAVIWIPYHLYSPSFRTKYVKMPNTVKRPLDFHILKN